MSRAARVAETTHSTMSQSIGGLDQGRELRGAGEAGTVDDQGRRQTLVRQPIGGESRRGWKHVDRRIDGIGERIDEARLAGARLARHQDADRLGLARLCRGQVLARGSRDVAAQLHVR